MKYVTLPTSYVLAVVTVICLMKEEGMLICFLFQYVQLREISVNKCVR